MIVGSLLVDPALAQQSSKQPEPPKASPKATTTFSTMPFDNSARRLPPNYRGHSLINVWAALHKRGQQFRKSEYETSEAWNSRSEKLKARPLIGSASMLSQFAFQAYDVDAFYNADAETISVTVSPVDALYDKMNGIPLPAFRSILGWKNIAQLGSFVGSNAFGVKRRIRAEVEQFYFMTFPETQLNLADTFTIENVGAERARLIKPQIRVLIVGKLQEPYMGVSSDQIDATLSDPVQTTSHDLYLYFKPEAIWFYNLRTGEVYHRALIPAEVPN
jgi:hypothetical protein